MIVDYLHLHLLTIPHRERCTQGSVCFTSTVTHLVSFGTMCVSIGYVINSTPPPHVARLLLQVLLFFGGATL